MTFLLRARRAFPTKPAVIDPSGSVASYEEVALDAESLAGAIRGNGIAPGERVAVLDYNTRWLATAHFGVPGSGAVLVALNTRLAPAEYRAILSHASAQVLLVSADLVPALGVDTASEIPVEQVVLLPGSAQAELPGAVSLETWLQASDGQGLRLPADENDMVAVNYTSGTTGGPKGVVYTHRGAHLNALGVALEFELTSSSWYLWTLPMFHCNGWSLVWGVTAVGATHVCLPSFEAEQALTLIKKHAISHLCGAPVVLSELARAGERHGFRAAQVVRAAVGGAPPTAETIAAVRAMGFHVTHLYGLTETYGPSLVGEYQPGWLDLPDAELARRLSRQGVPTISVLDVQVTDANEVAVPSDGRTPGEIVIRSNTVMAGYLDDPQATADALRNGWFHTGDLGVMHPDGYIELTDRRKDVIISGGENIASVEVEKALAAHPGVLEAAVVATPHHYWGERPVAFVVRADETVTEAGLIEFARERLARFKVPDRIYFEDLPKTSTGKIQKHALRQRALSHLPESGAAQFRRRP